MTFPAPASKIAKGKTFAARRAALKVQLNICVGKAGTNIGQLVYAKDGAREFSQFAYELSWLQNGHSFNISPDLAWQEGYQLRKAPTKDDSCFFLAMADTEPDAWGRRVIARAHAKERKLNPDLSALTELDYLCAVARVVLVQGEPVAVIRRFDRTADERRIPFLSGGSFLQARRNDEHSYTEIVDVMRTHCEDFAASAQQLWRRLVFNLLITNVDDHLHNIGFLYAGQNRWKLSPAFDVNPFPDKDRESKTWLSEDTGPITSINELMAQAARFELSPLQALAVLKEVVNAVEQWRSVALIPDIGLTAKDLAEFAPAFEHPELERALALLR